MNSLDRLQDYLVRLERRLRISAAWRGAAVTAVVALGVTVGAVLLANGFAFSAGSVLVSRLLLFLALAFALGGALIVPLLRLNRRRAAREAERRFPAFEERLLTFTELLEQDPADPFLPLLAADSLEVAGHVEPAQVAAGSRIAAFAALAVSCLGVLLWLGTAGPGFLGYGTSLLWGGVPRGGNAPYYDVVVEPGNRTVRKRSDQIVTARLVGFRTERVRLMARYAGSSKWEQADMRPQPGGPGFEFLLAGVPESLHYYVDAGGVRSKAYRFQVVDLPAVKRIHVKYHYPAWTGLPDAVEDPGGDLRAVEGTTAEVTISTDRPLSNGALVLDDGRRIALATGTATVPVQKDGLYHVASVEQGEAVRLSEDYFIEAQKDNPPTVRIARPGRDARVSPIEEVGVTLTGGDDFGLQELTLHYSVNAGPEKTVPLLSARGAKSAEGATTIYLEDYKLSPGDIVSLYATARDARTTARTDMFFLEAQPYEREYSQSQQAGGGGGADAGEQQGQISQRQKEIIAATWNQIRDRAGDKASAEENARFLAGVQAKLRDQSKSLVERMRSRQLAGAGNSFKGFVEDMDKAIEAMGPASDKLKGLAWQAALEPEQKALQHLLRAEATFRNIQVAFGNRGGGGGGGASGGAGRDLEGLFDLELDTEKNQYEAGQQSASADSRQKEIDEALQKLERLARRQQELAAQQRTPQQAPQQRWEQEMLRREAEELRRQMQQLSRGQQGGQSQQAQQGQSQQGQSQQGQMQRGQMQSQSGQPSPGQAGSGQSQQLERAMDRLQQALRDMRQAAGAQQGGSPQGGAEARRAAERLEEARNLLSGLRREQSGQEMDDLARRGDDLARRQRDFSNRMRQAFGRSLLEPEAPKPGAQSGTGQDPEQLAQEKQRMLDEEQKLERDMQQAVRAMAGSQRQAAGKLREALGNLQQEELSARMRWSAEAIQRGLGAYAAMREALTTQALDNLAEQLKDAQKAMGPGGAQQSGQNGKGLEDALAQAERLRQQMEALKPGPGGRGTGVGDRRDQALPSSRWPQGGLDRGGDSRQGAWRDSGDLPGVRRGNLPPGVQGTPAPGTSPEDMERAYQQGLGDLARIQRAIEGNAGLSRDVRDLMHDMGRFDPCNALGDPELLARLHARVLAEIEQVELELRRMVDDKEGGKVRSTAGDPVPPGYSDAVAEYFRRLSKNP